MIRFLVLTLFCAGFLLKAETIYCNLCGEEISSRYFTYQKPGSSVINICQSCKSRSDTCEMCKIPVLNSVSYNGKNYCPDCYSHISSLPSCDLCRKQLTGEYKIFTNSRSFEKSYFCSDCCLKYPACTCCGKPATSLYKEGTDQICRICREGSRRCRGCNVLLLKQVYTYELFECSFCEKCEKTSEKCFICSLPSGVTGKKLSDGRVLCCECLKTAITDLETARKILQLVSDFLIRKFDMKIGEVGSLEFCDAVEMKKKASDNIHYSSKTPLGLFSKEGCIYKISVLDSLPKNTLAGVLAHEYTHAWVHTVNPDYSDLTKEEGACEWIRMKLLTQIRDQKGCEFLRKQEGIYREGLDYMLNLEKLSGSNAVLDIFRKK